MEKEIGKYIQASAILDGEAYFEGVKDVLKRALEEIENNEKHWKEAINNMPYLGKTKSAPNDLKVKRIEWTVDYLSQINLQEGKAVRATAHLATAFNIEFLEK